LLVRASPAQGQTFPSQLTNSAKRVFQLFAPLPTINRHHDDEGDKNQNLNPEIVVTTTVRAF